MQGIHLRKYGVEAKIPFVLYEVDGVDLRTDAADGGSDCSIMKDEGAEATCDNDFVDEGKGYSITLTATEMEAARIVVYIVDSATKVWLDDALIIETYGNASAQHAFDLDTAATAMRGTDNAALASGVDVTKMHGTALTESSAGNIAGNMSTFWDNADAATAKTVDDVGAASGGGSPLVLGAGDVGDFKKDGVVHFFWNTIDRSGAAVAPSTAGTLRVYKDDGTGEVTAPTGITDTRAFDGVTGLQECKIDLSATTFYAKEKNYSVILVGAVVDTKTVNVKVGSFSIENRWANVHFHYGGK